MFVASHKSYDVKLSEIDGAHAIKGDKTIAEETIERVADFILKQGVSSVSSTTLKNLKIKPLSHDEIQLGITLIEDHPFVVVVQNKQNKDPKSDLILITREFTLGINDERLVGLLGREGLEAAFEADHREEITLLGVSTNAWETIQRYERSLA